MNMGHQQVAVLMGGWSTERSISLESGSAVLDGLQRLGVNAFGFDVTLDSVKRLGEQTMDCAFNIVHGCGGEDGILQAVLSTLNIAFTGSGVTASAVSMNKVISKQIWEANGITTPRFMALHQQEDIADIANTIGFPCAIKPISEGSSIGVHKVERADQVEGAWHDAYQCGKGVFAEQWIDGTEYAVGIVGDEVLPPVQLEPQRDFYDYIAKYEDKNTAYHCPCNLEQKALHALQTMSFRAYQALGLEGWGRMDAICDQRGIFYLLEANTVPGMTSHSLVPMAAKAQGIEFDELVMRILSSARRHI